MVTTFSRFLATIDQPTVEAFRTLFQQDLLARPLAGDDGHLGGLRDRGIPTNFAISLGLAVV